MKKTFFFALLTLFSTVHCSLQRSGAMTLSDSIKRPEIEREQLRKIVDSYHPEDPVRKEKYDLLCKTCSKLNKLLQIQQRRNPL